jgi:hypothetical protein
MVKETHRLTEQITNGEASSLGAVMRPHKDDAAEKRGPDFKLTHYRPATSAPTSFSAW